MNSLLADLPAEAIPTIELAQALVRLDTANLPGRESAAVDLLEARLSGLGVTVERHPLEPGRDNLIARLRAEGSRSAICFSGHLDTVPFDARGWTRDPLGGDIDGGRLWGRGATDMKGGIAAMVTAFERLARSGTAGDAVLVLTASEETGCQGAASIADRIGPVGAMVVAEPTNNQVALGHKGALWLRLEATGVAAHGSMPHLGINAVDRMVDAVVELRSLAFDVQPHPLLGMPTRNIGAIEGGAAANMVPDSCRATLDIRLVPGLTAAQAMDVVRRTVGADIRIEPLIALDAVATPADHPWIRRLSRHAPASNAPGSVSYFTDASVLAPALGMPPVAILGPGDPALAHQVDESCPLGAIWDASRLYERLAQDWLQPSTH